MAWIKRLLRRLFRREPEYLPLPEYAWKDAMTLPDDHALHKMAEQTAKNVAGAVLQYREDGERYLRFVITKASDKPVVPIIRVGKD